MKQRILPKSLILPSFCSFSLVAFSYSAASLADEKKQVDDVKPSFATIPKEKIDAEQMRLVKATHKRIMERQAKEKNEFKAYTDKMQGDVEFTMQPIKTKPFTWKGEEEGDVLEVTLDDFWMASTETTWAAYNEYYNPMINGEEILREKDGSVDKFQRPHFNDDFILLARPTRQLYDMTWGMGKLGFSAVGITHHAANKFCQWLSYQTGHFYRLPTEAEWEYACRGGSEKKYSWGDDASIAGEYAWYAGNYKEGDIYHKPAEKKANGYGLYDMHGNVLELTLDGFVKNRQKHFGKKSVHNPWVKATKPYPHVTKGGHWKDSIETMLSSARVPSSPNLKRTDPQGPKSIWAFSDASFLGFRVVRPVKVPSPEEMYHYWNSGTAYDGEMAVYWNK